MDKALVGATIRAAFRNGEEILPVEGELVVIRGNCLLFRTDFQALRGDGCVFADLCQILIFIIDEGKGRAEAYSAAAYVESAGSDRDSGLFHSLDHHIAAGYLRVVENTGTALSEGLHHGHGEGETHALSLAAHCPCQGLGRKQTRESAVQILCEDGVRRNAVGCGNLPVEHCVGLIVVNTDCHADRNHIGIDQGVNVGGRNVCAGGIGAVVRPVFGFGIYALGGEAAANPRLGLVGSDIDTHSRGNVHGVLIEPGQILRGSTGILQCVARGFVVRCGSVGQIQPQRTQYHSHQRAVGHAGGKLIIGSRGDTVQLLHDLRVGTPGGGVVGDVGETDDRSDFFEVPVKACAVGHGESLGLVFVQSFRINNDTSTYVSLPVKVGTYIGSGEIDGNGASNRHSLAGAKAGGSGVGLSALARAQVKIRLLGNRFALIVCCYSSGIDDISAAEGKACALIDRGSDRVLHDIEGDGRVNRDVLGAGPVRRQRLADAGSRNRCERLLSADGVLTRYGDRVNVVMDNGLYAERSAAFFGSNGSVLANDCFRLCVHLGHGEGRAHADTLTADLTADLIFDGQTVVRGGGGSGGVDLVGGLGIHFQNAGQLHLVLLLVRRLQSGEDCLGIRFENRQGKAACHAHVRGACAGHSGGADAVSDFFQLTGIAVLGGKLGNGGFQKQIQTDCCHHLLFFQFLTEPGGGGLILQQSFDQEAGVQEQLRQILDQAVCQRQRPGGDRAQRIALQIGEYDIQEHLLHFFILGELFILTVLFNVLVQKLIPLFIFHGEVVQQGVLAHLIAQGIQKKVSAGVGIRKVAQKLRHDFVHTAAVCRFQDVGPDNEIVRLDGIRTHIGLVLIFHIVDCRCRANTDGAVAGGGVRVDDGVGVLQAGDTHIACCFNAQAVGDAGKSLVGMNIRRDGSRHLDAALGGHHTGHLTCQAGHTARCHAAVFAGHAVYMAGCVAQRGGVILVDSLRFAVPVHGRGPGCISGFILAADQVIKLIGGYSGGSIGDRNLRRRVRARGAGVDVLADTADGLRRHLHALTSDAAVQFRQGGVVQDGKTHRRAYACPAAHCLRVGDELANCLGVRSDNHITGQFGHGSVELARNRLGVHRADRQRHDRCDGDAAGGTGRGLNVEVCLIVRLCLQRANWGLPERNAVFDPRDGIDVDHFHRDAGAHARGLRGHLERGNQGYRNGANLDALSGALAGGIGNGGVSAAAGGDDFHIAAVNIIACAIAEHRAVIDIGNVHGDRTADSQLGHKLLGGMACLGDNLRTGVEGLGFDAQFLRADSAPADARFVAVHKHFDGDRRADGVLWHILQTLIGAVIAQERRRTVQGAVCAHIRNGSAGGMDKKRFGSADAFGHIHFRKDRVLYVRNAQSADKLTRAAVRGSRGGGGILEDFADAVGAGDRLGSLTGKSGAAEKLRHELGPVYGGHLFTGRLIVVGNCQRHRGGSHIGECIHCHIVLSRSISAAVDDSRSGVEDKVAGNEQTGLGFHIPYVGGLAGGVAGSVHDAGGENLQRSARVNPRAVSDPRDGLKLHHGEGDGELERAAQGVGHEIIYGIRADEDACLFPLTAFAVTIAGDQMRRLADDHLGVSGGNCQCDGNAYLKKLVFRVDGNIHIGAGMDAAAREKIAVDDHIGIAELQGNGVKVFANKTAENIFAGNESLVENELCVQVDDLVREDLLVFRDFNVDIPIGFVEPQLNVDIVIGIQIVLHYGGINRCQRLVLPVGGEDHVLRADGTEYINLLADHQKVQSPGVQTVDAQLTADGLAQVIGEDKVGEEDAAFGRLDFQTVQVKADILTALRCDHIVCEGPERAVLYILHGNGAFVEQRVGEGFNDPEENFKAFGKIEMEFVVGQIIQKGDLRQGFNGDFHSVGSDGVNGNAIVFINAVIELAGQMQAVKAGLILDLNVGIAPCGKGSGGVYCDKVIALTALDRDAAVGKGRAVQLARDEVNRRLQEVLCEAEVPAAADAQPVLAVAAVNRDIGRAHVHNEAKGIFAVRIGFVGKGHDHIAGINELDAAHVLAVAQHHVHTHSGGITLRAANTVYEDILQGINIRKHIIETGAGVYEGRNLAEEVGFRLGHVHSRRHSGLSSHFHSDRVIAPTAVHQDMGLILVWIGAARNVGYAEVDRIVLCCTVILHAGRVSDADSIPGGEVQTGKKDVEPINFIDIDVDAALQLYIALGLRVDGNDVSLVVLHNGIMGNDAYGQLAIGGVAILNAQKLGDQGGQTRVFSLIPQIHTAKVQAVLHHDGGNPLRLSMVNQIGQRILHCLVNGVAIIVDRVIVLDLFADLMDIGAARGNGVGLHLLTGGFRLGRVILPGSGGGLYADSSRVRRSGRRHAVLSAVAGSGSSVCAVRRILRIVGRFVRILRSVGRSARILRFVGRFVRIL